MGPAQAHSGRLKTVYPPDGDLCAYSRMRDDSEHLAMDRPTEPKQTLGSLPVCTDLRNPRKSSQVLDPSKASCHLRFGNLELAQSRSRSAKHPSLKLGCLGHSFERVVVQRVDSEFSIRAHRHCCGDGYRVDLCLPEGKDSVFVYGEHRGLAAIGLRFALPFRYPREHPSDAHGRIGLGLATPSRTPRRTLRRHHVRISRTTLPYTSVNRKSRPPNRCTSRSWSIPIRCKMVAWRSCMWTLFWIASCPNSSV
jgi:hypothetical protein